MCYDGVPCGRSEYCVVLLCYVSLGGVMYVKAVCCVIRRCTVC